MPACYALSRSPGTPLSVKRSLHSSVAGCSISTSIGCIDASVVPQAGAISNLRTTAATMSLVSTRARLGWVNTNWFHAGLSTGVSSLCCSETNRTHFCPGQLLSPCENGWNASWRRQRGVTWRPRSITTTTTFCSAVISLNHLSGRNSELSSAHRWWAPL